MLTKNVKKKKTFFKPPGMQMTSISASRLYERSTWEPFCLTLRWEVFFRTSLTVKLIILLCFCKICIFIHNLFCLTLRWEVFLRTSLMVKLFILLCCCKICILFTIFLPYTQVRGFLENLSDSRITTFVEDIDALEVVE